MQCYCATRMTSHKPTTVTQQGSCPKTNSQIIGNEVITLCVAKGSFKAIRGMGLRAIHSDRWHQQIAKVTFAKLGNYILII